MKTQEDLLTSISNSLKKRLVKADLITSAQTLTGTAANLGAAQDFNYYEKGAIWLNVDINNSLNVRVQVIAKMGSTEYYLPIETVSATDIKIEPEYIELNQDLDQKIIFEFRTNGLIPSIQIKVYAGTLGLAAGQILEAHLTKV